MALLLVLWGPAQESSASCTGTPFLWEQEKRVPFASLFLPLPARQDACLVLA